MEKTKRNEKYLMCLRCPFGKGWVSREAGRDGNLPEQHAAYDIERGIGHAEPPHGNHTVPNAHHPTPFRRSCTDKRTLSKLSYAKPEQDLNQNEQCGRQWSGAGDGNLHE